MKTGNTIISLEDAAKNSADTFCTEHGRNMINMSEHECWVECRSQYKRGASWQKEQLQPLIEEFKNAGTLVEFVINALPTGSTRNLLTDANIMLKSAIEKLIKP